MAVCGVLFNLLAILANRGYMPYVPFGTDDTEREGTFGGAYGPFDRSTRLRLLADWIDLGWVGQVSPGDLLIAAGILAQLSGWAVY